MNQNNDNSLFQQNNENDQNMQQDNSNELNKRAIERFTKILIENKIPLDINKILEIYNQDEYKEIVINLFNSLNINKTDDYDDYKYYLILPDGNYNYMEKENNIINLLSIPITNVIREYLSISEDTSAQLCNYVANSLDDYVYRDSIDNYNAILGGTILKIKEIILGYMKSKYEENQIITQINELNNVMNEIENRIKGLYCNQSFPYVSIGDFLYTLIHLFIFIKTYIEMFNDMEFTINLSVWLYILVLIVIFSQIIRDKRYFDYCKFVMNEGELSK